MDSVFENIQENMSKGSAAFSICIPVYNCSVFELVSELHRQAHLIGYPFEILLIDDHSSGQLEENRKLKDIFSNVFYTELEKNAGRAKIRNLLAQKAQYPYLIFMDCDTAVCNDNFLRNYLNEIPADVVTGGYRYSDIRPEKKYMLRWKYGICREQRSASERNRQPNKSFSTFNFMIHKDIFERIQFDENISGYGHEDTLFGWELKKQGIAVKHIDNPLIHKSLDETGLFLKKTENSILNLWKIYQRISGKEEFIRDNALLANYIFLRKNHLSWSITLFFYVFRSLLRKNLFSKNPCTGIFDLYRIGVMNEMANRN